MTFEFDELIHLFRILSFQYWLHTHTVVISDSILGVWTCFSWPLFSGFRSFFRGQNVEIFSGWTWRLIFNLSDYIHHGQARSYAALERGHVRSPTGTEVRVPPWRYWPLTSQKRSSTFSSTELLHSFLQLLPSCLVSPQTVSMFTKSHSSSNKATPC